jgi:hypothetical protein
MSCQLAKKDTKEFVCFIEQEWNTSSWVLSRMIWWTKHTNDTFNNPFCNLRSFPILKKIPNINHKTYSIADTFSATNLLISLLLCYLILRKLITWAHFLSVLNLLVMRHARTHTHTHTHEEMQRERDTEGYIHTESGERERERHTHKYRYKDRNIWMHIYIYYHVYDWL